MEKLKTKFSVKIVTWQKPEEGRIKFNIDVSFLDNSGKAGIGGIARNTNENFLFAFAVPIHCKDNNIATKILKDTGYEKFTIEMDSQDYS